MWDLMYILPYSTCNPPKHNRDDALALLRAERASIILHVILPLARCFVSFWRLLRRHRRSKRLILFPPIAQIPHCTSSFRQFLHLKLLQDG